MALPPPFGHGQEDEEAEDEDGDDANSDGGDGGDPDAPPDGVAAVARSALADAARVVLLRFRLLLDSCVGIDLICCIFVMFRITFLEKALFPFELSQGAFEELV